MLCLIVACVFLVSPACSLQTIVLNATVNSYSFAVNSSVEYIIMYDNNMFSGPPRVNVVSERAKREFPVMVVVRQQKEVMSWQVPLLVDSQTGDMPFNDISRTLCPNDIDVLVNRVKEKNSSDSTHNQTALIVSISTASPIDVPFRLEVESVMDFKITHSVKYNVTISPSKPRYFLYTFEGNASDSTKTSVLQVDSDDDVCMFISIQNSSCPVYDLEHDIRFEGYWETVNRRGGISLSQSKFPNGFFVIFVSKSDDYDCTGKAGSIDNREKVIEFIIKPSITYSDYINAIIITVVAIIIFYVVFLVLLCCFSRRSYKPMTMESVDNDVNVLFPPTPSTCVGDILTPGFDDSSSMDETEYDTITEAESVRDIFRAKGTLYLCDLARKDSRILQKKSYLYLWHVIVVAVFYGLPVVQLVVTYQKVLRETGNQDLCYYNFLCAHPLGLISDFNHLFSNVGYIMLGILFLILTYRRERMHRDSKFDKNFGIPQHYGLFYAMGVALIMEGILSGSYHICPNHSNFQFDTSFMYVMAVLCMVKIYQNRHPDINATAYSTFIVLAVIICLGMVGIMEGTIYFWVTFTIIHILTCLLLTVQIYYMGCWKLDRGTARRVMQTVVNDFRSGPCNVLRPVYKGRMILLTIGNVCNWALAIAGLYHHEKDFATYLLAIFMANTLLYTLFYIVMKLCHKERISFHAVVFIALGFLTWGAALYFFLQHTISWALTPAQSRQHNQDCKLMRFYDPHDIWHFLSASAMFFSFLVLLTLDDDLSHTHRSKIHVF